MMTITGSVKGIRMRRRTSVVSTVRTHDGVALSVLDSRARPASGSAATRPPAAGPTTDTDSAVVLLTGLGSSRTVWDRVIGRLGPRHRVITYDYRGHGRSSAAGDYGFEALLDDLDAVLAATAVAKPVLCGWSLGADLAVWYAARRPGSVTGVLALDGAIPVPRADPTLADLSLADPSLADSSLAAPDPNEPRNRMATTVERLVGWLARMLGVGHRLTPDQLRRLLDEVDHRRARVLDAYGSITVPVTVALSGRPMPGAVTGGGNTTTASDQARWKAAAEQLTAAFPEVELHWLDCDHAIPLRNPDTVATMLTASATAT